MREDTHPAFADGPGNSRNAMMNPFRYLARQARNLPRILAKAYYRGCHDFEVENAEVLNTPGPVLLVPNHVSWEDWLMLGCILDDDWKFVVSSTVAERGWLFRKIMVNRRTFPIDTSSPYAVRHMAEYLQKGGRLILFAEGRISVTGTLMKLFDGTGFLLHKTKAKLITCYLRGPERLPWTGNAPGWRKYRMPISVHFSEVLQAPECRGISMHQARMKITRWLRDTMVNHRFEVEMAKAPGTIPEAVAEMAKRVPAKVVLEDFNRKPLNYHKLLLGVDLLARKLRRHLHPGLERVGILMPNVNATPVVMLSLWCLGKVPAVLNYTTGMPVMLRCIELGGLRQVVTSRKFLEQARIDPTPLLNAHVTLIYVEDLRDRIGPEEKIFSFLATRLNPDGVIQKRVHPGDTAVILFTSGSEGDPKGVELTHTNILSNIRQMLSVMDLTDEDRVFNALPLFHSFGLTVGTILGLVRGNYIFLYPSPLHYRVVPTAIYDRLCTVFLSTNTFLNGYARRANPYDFRTVRYIYAAAEKLQESTVMTWAQKFGARVLEGYGATECSPCVSINTPLDPLAGSVGRLMPGMEMKFRKVEGVDEGGRLLVRGPNVMKGYLNPKANGKFKSLNGWYDTGDIVHLDDEGFLHIRGRLKRFAKVSGEMVSLTAVEEALSGAFPKYGMRHQIAIIALPDERRGEALVAVSNDKRLKLKEVREVVKEKGLPNIFVPREVKFVREIPKLGTGKVHHRKLLELLKK